MDDSICLKSKDGQEFKILKMNAELSILVKNVLQDYSNNQVLDILEVEAKTLKIVVDYLNHFKGVAPIAIQKPLRSTVMSQETDEWSANLVDKLSLEEIVDLSMAANYMEIHPLLDLVCAKIASLCKDKSQEELLETFGIKEIFTEEERNKIKEENKWIEDNL